MSKRLGWLGGGQQEGNNLIQNLMMNNDIYLKKLIPPPPPPPHLFFVTVMLYCFITPKNSQVHQVLSGEIYSFIQLFCNRSSINHDPLHPNSLEWAVLRAYIYESSHLLWLYVCRQSKCHSQTYRHERTHALITCTETHRNTQKHPPSLSLSSLLSLCLCHSVSLPLSLPCYLCLHQYLSLWVSLFLCYLPIFVSLCPCYLPSSVCQSLSLSLLCGLS